MYSGQLEIGIPDEVGDRSICPVVTGRGSVSDETYNRFLVFHRDNPHVYQELKKLALGLTNRGFSKYSIKGLFEVLRYNESIQTSGKDFKLNNNYTSLYARMLMQNEASLAGFFSTRMRGRDV
tara:strand:+ start:161 stop:529 length:369 start_codon:yes stop_codon:yes gene_type:complete